MRSSPIVRLVVMGMLLIGLMIPMVMIMSLVSERTSRRSEAVEEVGAEWGRAQRFGGPVLTIPYRYAWKDSEGLSRERVVRAFVLPASGVIEGTIGPETRYRGIFPVTVYTAKLKVSGHFPRPDLSWVRPAPASIDWESATLDVGVSDPRGIARTMTL